MKDLESKIQQALGAQIDKEGYDLVDLIPIPTHGDRMVRFRTLQEALDDFDVNPTENTVGYLIQIRQKRPTAPAGSEPASKAAQQAAPQQDTGSDGVYLPNGKLNVEFLKRNVELLFSAGDYSLAKNILKTIVTTGEWSAPAFYWIARCSEAEGRIEDAKRFYEESITYYPSLEAYQHFSTLLIKEQKDQQAAELLERALNLKSIDKSVQFELHQAAGNSWLRANNPIKAEKHFKKALDLDPKADAIQNNMGVVQLQQKKIDDALRFFQDAISANPDNAKALSGIAACHLAKGDKKLAHDFYARALGIELNNPSAIFHLVKCAYEIKSYATACRILEEYIQIGPINTNLLYSLAGLQYHLGRHQDVRATANQILNLKSDHTGAKELLKLIEPYAGDII